MGSVLIGVIRDQYRPLILFPFAGVLKSRFQKNPLIQVSFPTKTPDQEQSQKKVEIISHVESKLTETILSESLLVKVDTQHEVDDLDEAEGAIEDDLLEEKVLYVHCDKDLINQKVFRSEFVAVCNETGQVQAKKPLLLDILMYHRLNLNLYNENSSLYIVLDDHPDLVMELSLELLKERHPNLKIIIK